MRGFLGDYEITASLNGKDLRLDGKHLALGRTKQ
jgi:hypothetical protein